jgi:hypothetical protein
VIENNILEDIEDIEIEDENDETKDEEQNRSSARDSVAFDIARVRIKIDTF